MVKKLEIEWQGEAFTIPEDQWFELAEAVEEVITLIDIHEITIRPKLTKIARAYSIMINFAGGSATPAEVHHDMMRELGESKKSGKARKLIAANAIMVLSQLILGDAQDDDADADGIEKKPSKPLKATRRRKINRS